MKLETCRVLITGASGGIGQALVEQMCAAGAQVLAVGRDADRLAALRARFPERLHHVAADLGSAAGLDAVAAAAQAFGGLNCVIQAAGINRFDLLEQRIVADRPADLVALVALLESGEGDPPLSCVADPAMPLGDRWATLATVVMTPAERRIRVLDGMPTEAATGAWVEFSV